MKRLIITHPQHGHLDLTEKEDIDTQFKKIMKEGYGNKIPAVFHATMKDGSVKVKEGKKAKGFLKDPNVEEVTVISPLAGG